MSDQIERIIALNIRSGGGQRVPALLQYLDAQEPDTVVLTEWRNNASGGLISGWATQRGLHSTSLADAGSPNGIFIASRHSFKPEKKTPAGTGAGVLQLVSFEGFAMLACYFPQKSAKAAFFTRCFEIADEQALTPFLLLGDLNTGNQLVDKDAAGGAYWCASMFDELSKEHALLDLWRHSNGPNTREWTWLSGARNGFRIDHALGNPVFVQWATPTCEYDHTTRETCTDHSATIVTMHKATSSADASHKAKRPVSSAIVPGSNTTAS